MRFCSLFSGSGGNCSYIEYGGAAILIDAGGSLRRIEKALTYIGASLRRVAAVFLTHEHGDHISGLATLMKKYKIPIYASRGTIAGLTGGCDGEAIIPIAADDWIDCCGLRVTPFKTPHDANESLGFEIDSGRGRIVLATDLGYVPCSLVDRFAKASLLVIESNYDEKMLLNGRYPYSLKRRILGDRGHLSNDDCSAAVLEAARAGVSKFVLAHLSEENNLPNLALERAAERLIIAGINPRDMLLEAAPREAPTRLITV